MLAGKLASRKTALRWGSVARERHNSSVGPVSEGKPTAAVPSSTTSPRVSTEWDTGTGVIVRPARRTGCQGLSTVVDTNGGINGDGDHFPVIS